MLLLGTHVRLRDVFYPLYCSQCTLMPVQSTKRWLNSLNLKMIFVLKDQFPITTMSDLTKNLLITLLPGVTIVNYF